MQLCRHPIHPVVLSHHARAPTRRFASCRAYGITGQHAAKKCTYVTLSEQLALARQGVLL